MDYVRKVFMNQFPLVKWFVYYLISYRILNNGNADCRLRNNFWIMTIDAHLLRAAINWCMVFGSRSNSTHWTRLSVAAAELSQSFYNGLFQETGMDEERWQKYWKSMTVFRNKYAAHRELEPYTDPVPNFDTALAVAYDKWVRVIISPDSFDEPPVRHFAKSLKNSVTPLVDMLLTVTQEKVCWNLSIAIIKNRGGELSIRRRPGPWTQK